MVKRLDKRWREVRSVGYRIFAGLGPPFPPFERRKPVPLPRKHWRRLKRRIARDKRGGMGWDAFTRKHNPTKRRLAEKGFTRQILGEAAC